MMLLATHMITQRCPPAFLARQLGSLVLAGAIASAPGCGGADAPPASLPAQVPVATSAAPTPAAQTPAPAADAVVVGVPPPAVELPPGPAAACGGGADERAPRSAAVHRWVDGAGITHYSDRPPTVEARAHRVLVVSGLAPISIEAAGYDVSLPEGLQQQAVNDALAVARVLRDELGVAMPTDLRLRIVFVRSAEAYARLIDEPLLAGSAGAWSSAKRTIYLHMQASDEASFAVLRHELTHAIVHEAVGGLPLPLNEGLAEYFGRHGAGRELGQAERRALIAAAPAGDGSEALVDLLARDGRAFYGSEAGSTREQRYRRAHALVALLMQRPVTREVLADVLAAQRLDPCRPVALERLLDQHYPGGLAALAGDWAAFMRKPPVGSAQG